MRELKFRAWDKWKQKMVQPKGGDFIGWHAMSNWRECLEVMQFTGLHDANGVEIYEGDIVGWGAHLEVKEVVFYNPENAGFETESSMLDKCMVVIGNIHENPELVNT